MGMSRASRRRADRRRRRLETGRITEGDIRRILEGWRKEAEYRARVAFGDFEDGVVRVAPAVWALYRSKLPEAMQLEAFRREFVASKLGDARRAGKAGDEKTAMKLREKASGISVYEELAEYCRRAIARHTEPATVHRTFMIGPGVALVRG